METKINEVNEYFASLSGKSYNTVYSYKVSIGGFFEFMSIETIEDLKKIESKDIRNYSNKLLENNQKSTVNTRLRALKTLFLWMFDNEYIESNPFTKVKYLKESSKIPVVVDTDERDNMIKICRNNQEKLFVTLLFYTGLRRNEAVNVKFSDIRDGKLLVRVGKGDKQRSLKLTKNLMDLVAIEKKNRNCSENDYVIVSERGKHQITPQSVRLRIKSIAERAGIDSEKLDKLSSHSARRSFACNLINSDVDITFVQKALGHANLKTTVLYLRGNTNKKLDEILENQR